MSDQFTRQSGIVPIDRIRDLPITVVGAGGIGSTTTLFLAKMGCRNLTVYDFDKVEIHNIPNQMYPKRSLGQFKVHALRELIRDFEEFDITAIPEAFSGEDWQGGVLILAVDSMKARKEIFESVQYNPKLRLLIDGRMGGWVYTIYTIDACSEKDMIYYAGTLYSDAESVAMPCTERAVIFNTGGIGSGIAKTIALYAAGFEMARDLTIDLKLDILLRGGE